MPTAATVTTGWIAARIPSYAVSTSSRPVVTVTVSPATSRIFRSSGPPSREATAVRSRGTSSAASREPSGAIRQYSSGWPVVASRAGAASGGSSSAAVQ